MRSTFAVIIAALLLTGLTCTQNTPGYEAQQKTLKDAYETYHEAGSEIVIGIPDQAPRDFVTVATTKVPYGTVIVIKRKDPLDGTVLGSTEAMDEEQSGSFVILLSDTAVDGETLYAVLYEDNDRSGGFSRADTVFREDGAPVVRPFRISSSAIAPEDVSI